LSSSSSRTTGTGGGLLAGEAKGAIGGADLEEEGDAWVRGVAVRVEVQRGRDGA
jgi:hypothetical protein